MKPIVGVFYNIIIMAKVIKICWVRISVLKEVQLYRKRQITNDIIGIEYLFSNLLETKVEK